MQIDREQYIRIVSGKPLKSDRPMIAKMLRLARIKDGEMEILEIVG